MGNLCAPPRIEAQYEKKLKQLQSGNQKYTDKDFPADNSSLIQDWKSQDPDVLENKDQWAKVVWQRAPDFKELNDADGTLQVFADKIEPNDIKQGGLGNCYFLSVLACIAERAYRIRRLFISRKFNKQGIYSVQLTKNGEHQCVMIDDFFPTLNNSFVFSSANGNELWVLIMEKAWAKVHHSYHRIIGGQCHETFRDVTGAPSWEIMSKPADGEVDDVWERIMEGDQKNYIMAAGVSQKDADEGKRLQEFGLVGGHAYSLMRAAVVKNKAGVKVQIVQVRNPWGSFEWKGDWSDNSNQWTDEAKKQVDFTNEDDGTFWMEFEEFRKFFTRIQICKYIDCNKFTSKKLKVSAEGYHLIKMVITQAGEHTVSVSQFDQRCAPLESGHEYTNCKVVVVRAVNGMLEKGVVFVKGAKGFMDRDTHVELGNVGPGTYYVCIEMENATNQNWQKYGEHIFVTNYGPGKTKFGADESIKYPVSQVLEAAFTNKIRRFPDQFEPRDMGEHGAKDIAIYEQKDPVEGYRFAWVNNKNETKAYTEEMTYSELDGQQILKPTISKFEYPNILTVTDMSYKFYVPPGDTKMVIIRCNVQGYGMKGGKKNGVEEFKK